MATCEPIQLTASESLWEKDLASHFAAHLRGEKGVPNLFSLFRIALALQQRLKRADSLLGQYRVQISDLKDRIGIFWRDRAAMELQHEEALGHANTRIRELIAAAKQAPASPFHAALDHLGKEYGTRLFSKDNNDDPFDDLAIAEQMDIPPETRPMMDLRALLRDADPDLEEVAFQAVLALSYERQELVYLSSKAAPDNPK